MVYEKHFAGVTQKTEPETFDTCIEVNGMYRRFTGIPYLRFKSGETVGFDRAKCASASLRTGTAEGVRAVFSDFAMPGGLKGRFDALKVIMDTQILTDGFLRVSVRLENEPEDGLEAIVLQPLAFQAPKGTGYTVLPRMQGVLIPAECEKTPRGGHYEGIVYERDAYMPMFGQVTDTRNCGAGWGYAAIFDTPFDARYLFDHDPGGDTVITPVFVSSLGRIGYKRSMLYRFETNCDYTRIAKIYRAYVSERGKLVTLKEKSVRTPRVASLAGCPVVHTGIAVHISPDSQYFRANDPKHNDYFTTFETRASQLGKLHEKGVNKAYLHLDGWGNHGYDNLHPSPFPPHEASGGAEGMKALSDTCERLGYFFGIHDQYRDYYYDAPDFSMENAVQYEDGSHPYCDIWYGGKHTWLCSKLAPEYVRRNYDTFEKLGIRIDGTYLDVFSVVFLDECFHPDHKATRQECAEARRQCFDLLNARGIITSSEETLDCIVPSIALCHHAPHWLEKTENGYEMAGIPIPLFDLVWHDCIVIPWNTENDPEYVPAGYTGLGLAYINGGTAYMPIDAEAEEIERLNDLLRLHEKIAFSELTRHELVNGDPMVQRSVFAGENGDVTVEVHFCGDGTKITVC